MIADAKAGDRGAQERLFNALYPLIHKHVSFLLRFDPAVEDAVQESMLQVHRALPKFRGEASISTWAMAIASRTARRHWKKELKESAVEPRIDQGVYDLGQAEAAELSMLAKALDRLSPKKREAFILMAIFELSAAEAAKVLGTFSNTAASRFRHAKKELASYYQKDFDEIHALRATEDTKVGS